MKTSEVWSSELKASVDEVGILRALGPDMGLSSVHVVLHAQSKDRWLAVMRALKRVLASVPDKDAAFASRTAISLIDSRFVDTDVALAATFLKIDALELLGNTQSRLGEIACTLVPLLRAAGDPETALLWFRKASAFYDHTPEAFSYDAAALELDLGRPELALDLIDSSIGFDVSPVFRMRQLRLRSHIYNKLEQYLDARSDMLEAAGLARSSVLALHESGRVMTNASVNVLQHDLIEDHAVIFEDASDALLTASEMGLSPEIAEDQRPDPEAALDLLLEALALWDLDHLHDDLLVPVGRRIDKLQDLALKLDLTECDEVSAYLASMSRVRVRYLCASGSHLRLATLDGEHVNPNV